MKLRTAGDVGAAVRDGRRKLGLRQKELARKAGVSRQWLVELEKGKAGAPLGLVLRTMDALGITLIADAKMPEAKKTRTKKTAGRRKPVDINGLLDNLRKPKR